MARIRNLLNPWGKEAGYDPQRVDLWQVDLSAVLGGLYSVLGGQGLMIPEVDRYYVHSVTLPELKVKAEPVRRESRSYQMPSFDEALDAVQLEFIVDDATGATQNTSAVAQSKIYRFLDLWRRVVRAGRGAVGFEQEITLNANYRIDYAYDINLYLLRGYGLPSAFLTESTQRRPGPADGRTMFLDTNDEVAVTRQQVTEVVSDPSTLFLSHMNEGLFISGILVLENAWLAGFKVNGLDYKSSNPLTLSANLYCDNIRQTTTDPQAHAAL